MSVSRSRWPERSSSWSTQPTARWASSKRPSATYVKQSPREMRMAGITSSARGAEQGADRLHRVVAAREMVRQHGRPLRTAVSGRRLQEMSDALVELAPLLQEQALVGDLLRQALTEAELVVGEHVLAMEEPAPLELLELVGHVDSLVREELRELPP